MAGVSVQVNDGEARDLHFTPADFRRIRELVYQHAGIALAESKTHMAYSRLSRRLRALGKRSFAEYLDLVEQQQGGTEWQHFINALTTNLTSFFREPHHFQMLCEHALQHAKADRPYRVWCAASSTGEEPYSIAMELDAALRGKGLQYEVHASDIDTQVLATAAAGIYPLDRIDQLSGDRKRHYFLRGKGSSQGKVKVKAELAERVRFFQLNLIAPSWPGLGQFDLVFCRNVMIYFDKPTQASILEHMVGHLEPHALLLLGHSENVQHITRHFVPCGRTAYRLA